MNINPGGKRGGSIDPSVKIVWTKAGGYASAAAKYYLLLVLSEMGGEHRKTEKAPVMQSDGYPHLSIGVRIRNLVTRTKISPFL